jgi:ABC-type thiamine transport system substrate-binding protein
MLKRRRVSPVHAILTLALVALAGCRSSTPQQDAGRAVTVYVSTDRVFSEPILREYEKQSCVTVNAVYDTEETKSTGLANRLLAEKARPQADVFWSNSPLHAGAEVLMSTTVSIAECEGHS